MTLKCQQNRIQTSNLNQQSKTPRSLYSATRQSCGFSTSKCGSRWMDSTLITLQLSVLKICSSSNRKSFYCPCTNLSSTLTWWSICTTTSSWTNHSWWDLCWPSSRSCCRMLATWKLKTSTVSWWLTWYRSTSLHLCSRTQKRCTKTSRGEQGPSAQPTWSYKLTKKYQI